MDTPHAVDHGTLLLRVRRDDEMGSLTTSQPCQQAKVVQYVSLAILAVREFATQRA
jgi:hypothetical protein